MNKQVLFATTNQEKMKEIRMILADLPVEVLSLSDAGIEVEIIEDGQTFEENAIIKAKKVMELTGMITLADDSGLEVDYLDKAPGIYSARFLGEDTPYAVKNKYILEQLEGVEKERRTARFLCAIAAAFPDGRVLTTKGSIEGFIGWHEAGEYGFGFDPIFFLPEYGCTTAQLSPKAKNEISHRGIALKAMKEVLEKDI